MCYILWILHLIQSTECQLRYFDMMNDWTVLFTHILVDVGSSQYQFYIVIYFNFCWYDILAWTLFLSFMYSKYFCLSKKTILCVLIYESLLLSKIRFVIGLIFIWQSRKKMVKKCPSSFYFGYLDSNVFTIRIEHYIYVINPYTCPKRYNIWKIIIFNVLFFF